MRAQNLKDRFLSYICYLMIAIYLAGYFDSRSNHNKGLDNYTDDEFKAIFEFETDSKRRERLKKEKKNKKKDHDLFENTIQKNFSEFIEDEEP